MAHVVYALCGYGRGHLSRGLAVAEALRERGHAVAFAAGGDALDRLSALGEHVRPVPALRQVIAKNRVRLVATARANLDRTWTAPETVAGLAEWFRDERPDLLVSDFEPFTPRAAERAGVPVVALSHQQVLTETRWLSGLGPSVPLWHLASAAATAAGVRLLTPRRPAHVVVPTFFFPPVKDSARVTLVPPVLRRAVLDARPRAGERLLVYLNAPDGADATFEALDAALGADGAPADVYLDGPLPPSAERYARLQFRPPSLDGFARDLARSRAVVCTAGFTLLAEALHLGKPVLALPNGGFFEQTLNALHLAASGRGEAVAGRPLRIDDVRGFLRRAEARRAAKTADAGDGRRHVVACLERVLRGSAPRVSASRALAA